ncbi:hypothetical protein ASPBRDRAFT_47760 [Aspergillus brasiliensis CBS 101740]|uniref:Uncharacterized protein n=1 Tax=Aspergillus brasiliensis (strain CBS 101740 / IMI 381727 / IBT 21946) TaxID=767769 RepID=A0A1L9U816_ASPBC|nr:hypothetical protein ASPBRDRAFT_47760 [Aspergillus brasiliensis CBS 101740]
MGKRKALFSLSLFFIPFFVSFIEPRSYHGSVRLISSIGAAHVAAFIALGCVGGTI